MEINPKCRIFVRRQDLLTSKLIVWGCVCENGNKSLIFSHNKIISDFNLKILVDHVMKFP